jgi:hypothetical protein
MKTPLGCRRRAPAEIVDGHAHVRRKCRDVDQCLDLGATTSLRELNWNPRKSPRQLRLAPHPRQRVPQVLGARLGSYGLNIALYSAKALSRGAAGKK